MKEQLGPNAPADEDRFDSNCITPGTEFMALLTQNLHFFIKMKIQEDPNWRNIRVILSGHEVRGSSPLLLQVV
jgi:5'-3' exoribonuclease 1